jgi:multidrug efflux pump subunit AcrA (membrane-fusion protein)
MTCFLRGLVGLGFALAAGTAIAGPEKEKAPVVFTAPVKTADLFDTLLYPARLTPKINATLLSESDGIVTQIQAPLGRTVRARQTVLTITNTDPVYNFAPLRVLAPVSGVVSSVEVTEGSRVLRGQKLATITDPSQIRIDIEVPASDLGSIHAGMQGELRIAAQEKTVAVKILGISPFVDPASGTATAQLGLMKSAAGDPVLLPGVVGTVTFQANAHRGVQIPEVAVIYRGADPFVRVIENGKAHFLPVTLGPSRRGDVEVLKGLQPGATLLVRANTYVADGEAVTVQTADTP